MPHFVLDCIDSDEAPALRPLHRPAHLDHVRASGLVRLAGPLSDAAGKTVGSLIVLEAADLDAARAFSEADPFRRLGVYRSVEIRAFSPSYVDMPAA